MIRLDEVRERISGLVEELPEGRIGNAADFANVVETEQVPAVTPHGFVMFGGLQGTGATAATGMFIQNFNETVMIVLMDRVAGDPLGDRALRDATPIVRKIINAVVGWAPAGAIGVFVLQQAELVGAKDGMLVFQIDFALQDQLRITPA